MDNFLLKISANFVSDGDSKKVLRHQSVSNFFLPALASEKHMKTYAFRSDSLGSS